MAHEETSLPRSLYGILSPAQHETYCGQRFGTCFFYNNIVHRLIVLVLCALSSDDRTWRIFGQITFPSSLGAFYRTSPPSSDDFECNYSHITAVFRYQYHELLFFNNLCSKYIGWYDWEVGKLKLNVQIGGRLFYACLSTRLPRIRFDHVHLCPASGLDHGHFWSTQSFALHVSKYGMVSPGYRLQLLDSHRIRGSSTSNCLFHLPVYSLIWTWYVLLYLLMWQSRNLQIQELGQFPRSTSARLSHFPTVNWERHSRSASITQWEVLSVWRSHHCLKRQRPLEVSDDRSESSSGQ